MNAETILYGVPSLPSYWITSPKRKKSRCVQNRAPIGNDNNHSITSDVYTPSLSAPIPAPSNNDASNQNRLPRVIQVGTNSVPPITQTTTTSTENRGERVYESLIDTSSSSGLSKTKNSSLSHEEHVSYNQHKNRSLPSDNEGVSPSSTTTISDITDNTIVRIGISTTEDPAPSKKRQMKDPPPSSFGNEAVHRKHKKSKKNRKISSPRVPHTSSDGDVSANQEVGSQCCHMCPSLPDDPYCALCGPSNDIIMGAAAATACDAFAGYIGGEPSSLFLLKLLQEDVSNNDTTSSGFDSDCTDDAVEGEGGDTVQEKEEEESDDDEHTKAGRIRSFVKAIRRATAIGDADGTVVGHTDTNTETSSLISRLQLTPLDTDIIIKLGTRLLDLQERFATMGKPTTIRLGYHHTDPRNMLSIKKKGLMTRTGMKNTGTETMKLTGRYFGDGVYCGTNPDALTSYGSCGLFVAMLMGWTSERTDERRSESQEHPYFDDTIDSVLGNKRLKIPLSECPGDKFLFKDEIVLKNGSQCLPLFQYDTSILNSPNFSHTDWESSSSVRIKDFWKLQDICQPLVEKYINIDADVVEGTTSTTTTKIAPVQHVNRLSDIRSIEECCQCPVSDKEIDSMPMLSYRAPKILPDRIDISSHCIRMRSANTTNMCTICLDPIIKMNGDAVLTKACRHHFHAGCLQKYVEKHQYDPVCPVCKTRIMDPVLEYGRSLSCTMEASVLKDQSCEGFEAPFVRDSIRIVYTIGGDDDASDGDGDSGSNYNGKYDEEEMVQKSYHYHPDQRYFCTGAGCDSDSSSSNTDVKQYTAYVPKTKNGYHLFRRLRLAFLRGLVFDIIETSVCPLLSVSRRSKIDRVVWSTKISHKTNLMGGGESGYPDNGYLERCHHQLDALGVLRIDGCELTKKRREKEEEKRAGVARQVVDLLEK